MLTLAHIQKAHSRVKSGADFPAYAHELKKLGLHHYTFFLEDGHAEYVGNDGTQFQSDAKWLKKEIGNPDPTAFETALRVHQNGASDFVTLADQAARYGIHNWVVDLDRMQCTYFDRTGNLLVTENIPEWEEPGK